MEIKKIHINGQTIRIGVRPGLPSTTPLIIFNGIGSGLELALPIVNAMHPDLEVIAFDVPGVGGSSMPSYTYTFSSLAKTVTKILDYLGHEQVNVIGLSWGGFLAQQFAFDHPQRCKKLILAATSCGLMSVLPDYKVLGLMASPRRYTDPDYAASIAPVLYGGKFRYDKKLASLHARQMFAGRSPYEVNTGYSYQMLAIACWSSAFWLNQIVQPTLVLAGNDDPIIPLFNMKRLYDQIDNAELHVFDDGHLFFLTDLPNVAPVLNEFLL
ncbi:poly(3-hydroxyalkanoate) depolymerase [Pseudomonas lini]|jgi:poly(3-hydroxyalkanoate) depolymerase|uniref:poly(3-hydroxyalkanoate) depolymerase n=1 Tax=Pseudomonas lini TaxID=163011 RepID=UPI002787F7CF|nr:poly(3-hydroxyalkanoate) depolymerase [Pseudomonas lini]MDQ0123535.1 poly(3-hydroxyalkanoate) depolymerase [Pseudomonas lini]